MDSSTTAQKEFCSRFYHQGRYRCDYIETQRLGQISPKKKELFSFLPVPVSERKEEFYPMEEIFFHIVESPGHTGSLVDSSGPGLNSIQP